jgi:hypothetical protein
MLRELLTIYEQSQVNPGKPGKRSSLFAETLIFNEGWLLRAVLKEWRSRAGPSRLDFLPFPPGVKVYSEAQLYTPFKARTRNDERAEAHTHVDGIVGDFEIQGTKSGVVMNPDWRYLAVFEAKMYSPLSRGTKRASQYDQLSRTAACLINAILQTDHQDRTAHLVVLHARDNRRIDAGQYTRAYIAGQIADRIQGYLGSGHPAQDSGRFFQEWGHVLHRIHIQFLTWEDVLAEIGDDDLDQFYCLCQRFNRPDRGPHGCPVDPEE